MEEWYSEALDLLKKALREEGYVRSFDFLYDFIFDNRSEYFDDVDIDDIDSVVEAQLDNFQAWLNDNGISVSSGGHLRYPEEALIELENSVSDDSVELLSDEEREILSMAESEIDGDFYPVFSSIYKKLCAINDYDMRYECSIRLARSSVFAKDIMDGNRAEIWDQACEDALNSGRNNEAAICHKEAAYYYIKIARNNAAAQRFESAAKKFELTEDALNCYSNARIYYQLSGDHNKASKIFVEEMNVKRKNAKFCQKLILGFHLISSKYGESPGRVLVNIMIILFLSTLVSSFTVFSDECDVVDKVVDSIYYTLVTFTTLGYGDITPESPSGKLYAGFLAGLGLLYTSLFMVTVVRKYSRS